MKKEKKEKTNPYNRFMPLFTNGDFERRRFLTLEERHSILQVINQQLYEKHPLYYKLHSLLYWTGASLPEILQLRVKDVHVHKDSIEIPRRKADGARRIFKMPKDFMHGLTFKYNLKAEDDDSQSDPQRSIICSKNDRLKPRWDADDHSRKLRAITKEYVMIPASGINHKAWYAASQGLRLSTAYHLIIEKGESPERACELLGMNPEHAGEYYKFYAWHNGTGNTGNERMESGMEMIRNARKLVVDRKDKEIRIKELN